MSVLRELAALFLGLGATAFGGPAAHVALMQREVVTRRRWLDEQAFIDLVGLTSLLPGPNSTELAIAIGRRRAGWRGLVVAGVAFILPAALIVLGLAWAYERYGTTPAVGDLRYGLLPVIVAVIASALTALGRTALRTPVGAVLGALTVVGVLVGVPELALLVGAGAVGGLWGNRHRLRPPTTRALVPFGLLVSASDRETGALDLFVVFLRIGTVLFGGGYVLVAFLEGELVDGLGVLTEQQLLDAVTVGQVTPGPVFTTATFVGYVVAGVGGAVAATVGIFLPSFLLVAALGRVLERLLRSAVLRPVLDGLNAGAVGLMAGVTLLLADEAYPDALTAAWGAAALVALVWRRTDPTWLLAAGAVLGLVRGGLV